jgi:hypothetical protein
MNLHTCRHCERLIIQPRFDYLNADGATLEETRVFQDFDLNDVKHACREKCLLLQRVMAGWDEGDRNEEDVELDELRLYAHYGIQSSRHWFLSSMGLIAPDTDDPFFENELDLHLFALVGALSPLIKVLFRQHFSHFALERGYAPAMIRMVS